MPDSDGPRDYHLTVRDWDSGKIPADRVETWTREMLPGNSEAEAYISWVCVWASDDVSPPDRAELRKKYGAFMISEGRMGSMAIRIGKAL